MSAPVITQQTPVKPSVKSSNTLRIRPNTLAAMRQMQQMYGGVRL